MLIKIPRGWEMPERQATPESVYMNRRAFLAGAAAASALAGGSAQAATGPAAGLYPPKRNELFKLDRKLTPEDYATQYNNFYEFGTSKRIAKAAQALVPRPWELQIDGMVEKPMTLGIDDLEKLFALEERLYRFRCVEAWAMAVPWSGFPLARLIDHAKPLNSAKYVRFETFQNPAVAPGQRQFWQPWPYVEGLTVAEARNELSFIATGIYGKPLPPQNGAPLRLVTPWKYGFKNIKSIVKISFTDKRPESYWMKAGPDEYGFWANVNPEVPHPRWSQANEELIGTGETVPTELYNGYGDFVRDLYKDMGNEKLFM